MSIRPGIAQRHTPLHSLAALGQPDARFCGTEHADFGHEIQRQQTVAERRTTEAAVLGIEGATERPRRSQLQQVERQEPPQRQRQQRAVNPSRNDSGQSRKTCECGCGQLIPTKNRNGPLHFVCGHNQRGKKRADKPNAGMSAHLNYNWKGGCVRRGGYILVRIEGHPRGSPRGHYVREHALVMEQQLGRYLKPNEVVHHINGRKDDNRIENLQLLTNAEHVKLHVRLRAGRVRS